MLLPLPEINGIYVGRWRRGGTLAAARVAGCGAGPSNVCTGARNGAGRRGLGHGQGLRLCGEPANMSAERDEVDMAVTPPARAEASELETDMR